MNVRQASLIFHSLPQIKVENIVGKETHVVATACAGTHFLVLTKEGIPYAFGNNENGEIDPELDGCLECFTKLILPKSVRIREICTGLKFTAFILDNGNVMVNGVLYNVGEKKKRVFDEFLAPRGMSSGNNVLTFVDKRSRVNIWTSEYQKSIKLKNYNVVLTSVNDKNCVVLTGNGKILVLNLSEGKEFMEIEIDSPVKTVFKSDDMFHFQLYDDNVYLYENNKWKIMSVSCDLTIVDIQRINDLTIILDSSGKITYTEKIGQKKKNCLVPLPDFIVSSFYACSKFIIFFQGTPKMPKSAPPIKYHCCSFDELLIDEQGSKIHLLGFDSDNSYTREKNFYHPPFEYFSPDFLIEFKNYHDKIIGFTNNDRMICIFSNFKRSFRFNLIKDDIVKTKSGVEAKFIGFAEGRIWLHPFNSKYVFSPADISTLSVIKRPDHILSERIVDGKLSNVDVTPSFCEQFGHSIGDLIWYPKKGIVQFVGILSNRYVFMDYCNFSLFSSEIANYKLIRTFNDKISHNRNVLTSKGKIVKLNLCCKKYIFYPGDRVYSSELGDAIFLGTDEDGNSYIQSDEMKMADIEAERVSIHTLKLLRRFGIKAEREVMVNGEKTTISLSVESRYKNVIPTDIIQVNNIYARVVGISKDSIIAEPINGNNTNLFKVNDQFEIIYRFDILTGENLYFIENGSPAYDVSLLYPGDTVLINDDPTKFLFKGIGRAGLLFINTNTKQSFNLPFSPLILSDSFKVLERYAFRSSIYTSK